MWGTIAFVSHNWQWIIIGLGLVVGLGVLAFITKNIKLVLAAAVIVGVGLAGQALYSAGYNAKVNEDVAARTAILTERLQTLQNLSEADKQRSDNDTATIKRLQEAADATPVNNNACLDEGAADRIGKIK